MERHIILDSHTRHPRWSVQFQEASPVVPVTNDGDQVPPLEVDFESAHTVQYMPGVSVQSQETLPTVPVTNDGDHVPQMLSAQSHSRC